MLILTQLLRGSSKRYIYGTGAFFVLLLVFPVSNSGFWVTSLTQTIHRDQYKFRSLEVRKDPVKPSIGSNIQVFRTRFDVPIKLQLVSIHAPLSYYETSPIIIDNNTDFAIKASDFSWSGDGSPNKPYSIANLNITRNIPSEILISIKNTDVFFNITNCLLQGGTRGIQLENVTHGYIYNNLVFNNTSSGIFLQANSSFNTISTNLVNNSLDGIALDQSDDNNLLFNTVCNGNYHGIYVSSSNNTVVAQNYADHNYDGLKVWKSRNCTLSYNILHDNSYGIDIQESENNSIKNSVIFNNSGYGIQIQETEYCTLSNLTIHNNGRAGIKFWYSGHSKINNVISTWNNHDYGYEHGNIFEYSGNSTFSKILCSENYGTGIRITYSGNSTFSGITSSNNEGSGVFIQSSENSNSSDIFSSNNDGIGLLLDYSSFSTCHNITAINNSYDGLYVSYSNNAAFSSINSSYNHENGISWSDVHNSTISNSYFFYNNESGIDLDNSQNNTISTNIIHNNGNPSDYDTDAGIYLHHTNGCTVISNSVFSNELGIYLGNTNNSFISYNFIYDNEGVGFSFQQTAGNIVSNNIVYYNRGHGFYGYYWMESGDPIPENNVIKSNDFIENGYHHQGFYQSDFEAPNYQVDSNFWDNYRFPDSNEDGVVDFHLRVGSYWAEGVEDHYFYDENPQTQPNNPPGSLHYLTSPVIIFPTSWNPADPDNFPESQINGTVTIQWLQPLDSKGHTITYSLYYLQQGWDLGEGNWTEIASGLTATSYDWDTTNVIDTQYYIRINATCSNGLMSVYQDQGMFSIDNSPPLLSDAQASPYPYVIILISVITLGLMKRDKKRH